MTNNDNDLTPDEASAVRALKRLARKWPAGLWLFAASNTLHVMKKDADGKRALTELGCFDQASSVAAINIESDGGDW